MSDVAFILLIFIMLVALMNYRKEININYAQAQTALRTSDIKNLEIWIDVEGAVYLDGDPADLLAVEEKIEELYRLAPDTRIHIIADQNTAYEKISNVLEIMQILQYRVVSFVVKNDT